MKTVLVIVAVVMVLAMAAPVLGQSTDYSKMSTDQLYQLKQQGVPPDQRNNLESEWVKRAARMTPEERQKYQVPYSDADIQRMRQERTSPAAPGQ